MKQMIFMIAATLLGTVGVYAISPFWGIAVYYFFGVLRPQFLWQWVLPQGINWSFYVAISTMICALLVLVGVWSLGVEKKSGIVIRVPRQTIAHFLVYLFGFWILVTYFTAQHEGVAYKWFIEYSKIFVMFFCAAILVSTLKQLWILYLVPLIALSYIAYEINHLYFFSGYLGIYRNGYGGLDNNGAGLMLAMAIPLAYFGFESTRKWWRWGFLFIIPVILHAVLMTYSRGAMVSLIGATPVLFFRSRFKAWFIVFGIAILTMLPTMAGKEIQERFFTLEKTEIDASANSRFQSWKAAKAIADDYPIFGVGIRNANLFSKSYGADKENRTIHSQYLQILADNGYPGVSFYLLMFAGFFVALIYSRKKAKTFPLEEKERYLAIANGVESSLVVFSIGAIFLSLEVFELPYLILFIGIQLFALLRMTSPQPLAVSPSYSQVLGAYPGKWIGPNYGVPTPSSSPPGK